MIAIKLSKIAVEKQMCTITCETDSLSDGVSYQHPPGTIVGSCPFPGRNCVHGKYNLKQNLVERKTILTIPFYTKGRDDGDWLCSYRDSFSQWLNINALGKCSIKLKKP